MVIKLVLLGTKLTLRQQHNTATTTTLLIPLQPIILHRLLYITILPLGCNDSVVSSRKQ